MSEYMICNLVPSYPEAPISYELFVRQSAQVLAALREDRTENKYIVLNKVNKDISRYVEELDAIKGVSIISIIEQGGFVYGNKTAVFKVIHGEKPLPTGVDKKLPVYSVEELLASEEKLIYVGGNAGKKGFYTIGKTVKPRVILEQCGSLKEFKGMYFGYPMGKMINSTQLDEMLEITTDYVQIIDETDCILDQLLKIIVRYSKESCGRCVYGYEGITQLHMILFDMTMKKAKTEDLALLMDLCGMMKYQSLCDIGTAAAVTVLSAYQNFKEEVEEHITKKSCKAFVCEKFVTYHILPELCTGCTDCIDACDDDAILGKKKFIHVIDQEECTQCGACVSACEEGAIVKAGSIKPNGPKKPIPCK